MTVVPVSSNNTGLALRSVLLQSALQILLAWSRVPMTFTLNIRKFRDVPTRVVPQEGLKSLGPKMGSFVSMAVWRLS